MRSKPSQIAAELGCDTDTVLNAINAFNQTGLEALMAGSPVANAVYRGFDAAQAEQLKALLRQSPRNFGKDTGVWTLELAAEVSFEQGLPEYALGFQDEVWCSRVTQPNLHAWADANAALRAGADHQDITASTSRHRR